MEKLVFECQESDGATYCITRPVFISHESAQSPYLELAKAVEESAKEHFESFQKCVSKKSIVKDFNDSLHFMHFKFHDKEMNLAGFCSLNPLHHLLIHCKVYTLDDYFENQEIKKAEHYEHSAVK